MQGTSGVGQEERCLAITARRADAMSTAARRAATDGDAYLATMLFEHAFVVCPRVAGLLSLASSQHSLAPLVADEIYNVVLHPGAIAGASETGHPPLNFGK